MNAKPQKYRSQIRILADILKAVGKGGLNANPTHILYGANLSHDRLVKYLARLKERELIEERGDGEKVTYVLTEKGIEFLREFDKISRFAEAFGFVV